MKLFSLIILTCSLGCSTTHPGVYREIVPAAISTIHQAATNPAVTALASTYPPAAVILAIAGLLTGGAAGHYTGRRTVAAKTTPTNPAAPKLAA